MFDKAEEKSSTHKNFFFEVPFFFLCGVTIRVKISLIVSLPATLAFIVNVGKLVEELVTLVLSRVM